MYKIWSVSFADVETVGKALAGESSGYMFASAKRHVRSPENDLPRINYWLAREHDYPAVRPGSHVRLVDYRALPKLVREKAEAEMHR